MKKSVLLQDKLLKFHPGMINKRSVLKRDINYLEMLLAKQYSLLWAEKKPSSNLSKFRVGAPNFRVCAPKLKIFKTHF